MLARAQWDEEPIQWPADRRAALAVFFSRVAIVYVRDAGDLPRVRNRLRERLGDIPMPVVVAPVCRPGWLVEIEAVAILPASHPALPPF